MSSLIYCPAALWEMHEAQVIEIAWKEYERGSVVTILKCDRFFSSCPTNLQKDRWRCIDCVNQSNYTMRELLPPSAKIIWLKNSSKNSSAKRGVQVKYFELGYRPKTYLLSESGIFTFSGMLIEIQKWVDERKKELPLDTLLSEGMNFFTDWMAGRSDQPHFKWFLQDYNEKPNLKRTSNKNEYVLMRKYVTNSM